MEEKSVYKYIIRHRPYIRVHLMIYCFSGIMQTGYFICYDIDVWEWYIIKDR